MATQLGVYDLQITVTFQDAAPSYDYLKNVMLRALNLELEREDPTKARYIHWLGPGPRVTRKVNEGLAPGGTIHAVWPLVFDGPADQAPNSAQLQAMRQWIAGELATSVLQGYTSDVLGGPPRADVNLSVQEYNETLNGPESFWAPAPPATATITHTRDRFPTTNALGTPSADQNENPVGPSDPRLVPTPAPPVLPPGTLPDLTKFLIWGGVIVGSGLLIYFLWPVLMGLRGGASIATAPLRTNPSKGRVRSNPRGVKYEAWSRHGDTFRQSDNHLVTTKLPEAYAFAETFMKRHPTGKPGSGRFGSGGDAVWIEEKTRYGTRLIAKWEPDSSYRWQLVSLEEPRRNPSHARRSKRVSR